MANAKPSPSERRTGRVVQLITGPTAPATVHRRFELAVPIFSGIEAIAQGKPVPGGWIHWKTPPSADQPPEFALEVAVDGAQTLLPCRRVNRITDPYGVYIAEDGRIWCAWTGMAPKAVQAQVVGADIRQSSREFLLTVLPRLFLAAQFTQSS